MYPQVLIEYLVSGGDTEHTGDRGAAPPTYSATPVAVPVAQPSAAQWGAQTADAVMAAGNSPVPSAADLMEEERQLAEAMRASLAMVGGDSGGSTSAPAPARRSDPGSAMDPSHTFRALVIEMLLHGDVSARQDLVKAFDDLAKGNMFQSPRLLYFLLDNCKMEKLSKLPENVVSLWMAYLQRPSPQPALRDLIVLEGQLGKQGSKKWDTKGWKMKWFVMTDSMLCYYNKLTDKQEGKEPKNQLPLSAVIRLQMVGSDVSGMECSFEIVTEQDHPNWKVHAAISEDDGESQLYSSRWQSAIEEAMRGARDLERAFVNAKPQQYWADMDAQLQAGAGAEAGGRGGIPSEAPPTHQRQASAASSDGFDPREQPASLEVEAPAENYDPFAVDAPAPAPAPDLIGDLLSADTGLAKQVSSTDPFGSIDWSAPAPAPPPAAVGMSMVAPTAQMSPAAVAMPVMTPSPMQAAATAAAASPAPAVMSAPLQPVPAASNPFRTDPSNPFRSEAPPPAVSAPMGTPPQAATVQSGGHLVAAQARGFDGAINGNLFDEQAAKVPLTNPFAAAGASPGGVNALSGLRAAAMPLPGPTQAASNPFANLENDAWSKAAAAKSPPPAAVSMPMGASMAASPAAAPAVSSCCVPAGCQPASALGRPTRIALLSSPYLTAPRAVLPGLGATAHANPCSRCCCFTSPLLLRPHRRHGIAWELRQHRRLPMRCRRHRQL